MKSQMYAAGGSNNAGKKKKAKYSKRIGVRQVLRPGAEPANRAQRRAMAAIERKGGADNDQNRQPYPVPG